MEFKDFERLGKLSKEAELIIDTQEMQKGSYPYHSHFIKHYTEANKSLRKLKNHLENMMFIQCPKQATKLILWQVGRDNCNLANAHLEAC